MTGCHGSPDTPAVETAARVAPWHQATRDRRQRRPVARTRQQRTGKTRASLDTRVLQARTKANRGAACGNAQSQGSAEPRRPHRGQRARQLAVAPQDQLSELRSSFLRDAPKWCKIGSSENSIQSWHRCLVFFDHLITLSGTSTFGGIVRPICLAAFRLIISSNFVGCSTGRSAGLAPFKILSTYRVARRNNREGLRQLGYFPA